LVGSLSSKVSQQTEIFTGSPMRMVLPNEQPVATLTASNILINALDDGMESSLSKFRDNTMPG